jgi:hypothetical protein
VQKNIVTLTPSEKRKFVGVGNIIIYIQNGSRLLGPFFSTNSYFIKEDMII